MVWKKKPHNNFGMWSLLLVDPRLMGLRIELCGLVINYRAIRGTVEWRQKGMELHRAVFLPLSPQTPALPSVVPRFSFDTINNAPSNIQQWKNLKPSSGLFSLVATVLAPFKNTILLLWVCKLPVAVHQFHRCEVRGKMMTKSRDASTLPQLNVCASKLERAHCQGWLYATNFLQCPGWL